MGAGMKFLQISDTHQVASGEMLHGLDPRARLDACIAHINAHHGDAELCVITGDLADRGGAAAYETLKEALGALALPYRLMIGNHDDREAFRAAFPEVPVDGNGFVQSAMDTSAGRFVFLDSVEPGVNWGSFCETRAAWLIAELEAAAGPLTLFIHHPPFDIGVPSMDNIRLRDAAAFRGAVAGRRNIRHLFMGHVHQPVSGSWLGIPYSMIPSTNHQVPLDMETVKPVPKNHGRPAYAVAFIDDDTVCVHVNDYTEDSTQPISADRQRMTVAMT
jgi:3',5'-cyclic AMP phosphodiesterase CpdA